MRASCTIIAQMVDGDLVAETAAPGGHGPVCSVSGNFQVAVTLEAAEPAGRGIEIQNPQKVLLLIHTDLDLCLARPGLQFCQVADSVGALARIHGCAIGAGGHGEAEQQHQQAAACRRHGGPMHGGRDQRILPPMLMLVPRPPPP